MEPPKKTSYILIGNFPSSKNKKTQLLKKFLIFRAIEISSPKLKNSLCFF